MPILSFSGLATGLDSARLISELVRLERAPIQRVEVKQGQLNSQSDKLSNVKSLLEKLQGTAQGLDTRAETLSSFATSTQDGSVTATASGGASLGSFNVDVTSLATSERTYSDPISAKDQAGLFGSGQITIQVGSEAAVNIDVTASDTLETVASAINASSASVTAGVLFDGTNYRLQITGDESGAANAITFTESGTTLGLATPANQVQAAADAVFSIDGFSMTRPTNAVSDAIPGVTLDLLGATSGPATVTVQRDSIAIQDQLQEFVDAYNDVATAISAEFAYSGQARTGDSLSGDSTLRGLQSRLRTLIGQSVTALSEPYQTLYSIGIRSGNDGQLSIDEDALTEALANDPEAVAAVLGTDGGATGVLASLDVGIEEYVRASDGILTQRISGIDDTVRGLDDQIDRMEVRIEKYETSLRAEFAALESLVSGLQAQGNQMLSMLGQLNGQLGGG